MAEKVEFELVAKTDGAVAGVNKVDQAVKKTAKTTKKASKELSGMQQVGGAVLGKLDQLTGGLASKLVAVGSAAKLSGKAMKTALISSGIGAAVVAIGLLVEHWDSIAETLGFINNDLEKQIKLNNQNLAAVDIKLRNLKSQIELEKRQGKNVDNLIEKQKALNVEKKAALLIALADEKAALEKLKIQSETLTALEYFLQGHTGTSEITEEENDALIKQQGIISDLENSITNFDSSLLEPVKEVVKKDTSEKDEIEAEKEKAAALERIRKSLIDTEAEERIEKKRLIIEDFEEQIKLAEEYFGKESEKVKELRAAQKVAEDKQKKIFSDQDDAIQKAKDDKELLKTQKEQERTAKKLQSENAISIAKKRFAAEEIQDELLRLEKLKEIDLLEAEQETARLQAIVDNAAAETQAKIDAQIDLDEFLEDSRQGNLTRDKEIADASTEISETEADAKIAALDAYAKIAMDVSNLLGEETAAGKALSVAAATISTYTSATKAYESQLAILTPDAPVRAALAAGVAVATGLANVKKILSVKVPGQSSPTGALPSETNAPTPPAFNVVGSSGESQLADAIGGQAQRPARAYVVSNDVTTAQELDRNIIEGASIG